MSEKLFEEHQDFALSIARGVSRRHRLHYVSLFAGQLQQAALIGLWHAAKSFDESKGQFKSFAIVRIVGAVMDECRKNHGTYDTRLKRPDHVPLSTVVRFSSSGEEDPGANAFPAKEIHSEDPAYELIRLAKGGKQQTVLWLRYIEGLNTEEAGACLGVVASRVSQIEREAVQHIRKQLFIDHVTAPAR